MQKESSSSVQVFYPRFDREELIRKLKDKLGDLARELPLRTVVLFGSYARGKYTVASDIDVLVVYKGEEREDAFRIVKRTLQIPLLEPHVYSEDEYGGLKEKVDRMVADGVTLFPQEDG
jgi:predicted nucleotidyltransferase